MGHNWIHAYASSRVVCISHATIDAQVAGTYKSTGQKETANESLVLIALAIMCCCSQINTKLRHQGIVSKLGVDEF